MYLGELYPTSYAASRTLLDDEFIDRVTSDKMGDKVPTWFSNKYSSLSIVCV